jgi:hypothetical protein
VHVLVIQMAGSAAPWFLVTSALELSAAQVVEVWAARFRQQDGFRDHKQRLGREECHARTRPGGTGHWWGKPAWNRRKRHASIFDLRRLFWRHHGEFSQCVVALEDLEKIPGCLPLRQDLTERAA